ncbi:glycoside hydrolase family 16 protein [Pyxidicoccus fallax]|uniref:Glycoside hydrolase family 16 protein n=1 Tax=Pyxidicoccus fallax TaxID=394095 RepID=A0A848L7P6_9BACT|nr:glycoside hydrolase family 16 protein [Pyxidicoccus fallax]NMO14654.1 glycoside hydrolase family 16 protein [Pyxidicoccus fallax]NPC78445.1 glycoside hydrolase family 16 protein [Pyxidicoccus fallax]
MTRTRLLPWLAAMGTLVACDPAAHRNQKPDAPPPSTTPQPSTEWELVWQDEFEGPEGTPPATERWRHDVGGDGWGNAQLEFNTDRTENAALDGDGHLVITARKERYGTRDYTSARLTTKGRFERAYGRFEARLQMPVGRGMWPAFWLLGADIDEVGWPQCGEIDILEYRGQLPSIIRGSLHGPGYSGGNNIGLEHVVAGAKLNEDFHVYAVEWEPERIRWLLDGKVFFEATPKSLPAGKQWVYDHPHFIILNLAVGGNFVGPPDRTTVFPQQLKVDYVRVYARPE